MDWLWLEGDLLMASNLLSDDEFANAGASPAKTSAPAAPNLLSDDEFANAGAPQAPKPPVKTASDIGQSIAAKGTLGATADVPGLPGTLGQLYDAASQGLVKYGVLKPAEYLGLLPEGKTAEDVMSSVNEFNKKFQSPEEQAGDINTIAGLPFPTIQGQTKVVQDIAPFTKYEPQTPAGRYAGTAAEFATGAALTGGIDAIPSAIVSGVASEGASDAAKAVGFDADRTARIFGAVVGGTLASKLSNIVKYLAMPNSTVESELAQAMAKDFASGASNMTPDQIKEAIKAGSVPSIYDMAGPNTKAILKKYGYMNDAAIEQTGKLNKFLSDRANAAKQNVMDTVDGVYGKKLDAGLQQQAMELAAKNETDNVFKIAKADPNAQAISLNNFSDLADRPIFQSAMKGASENAANMPSFDIRPPQIIKGRPAIPEVAAVPEVPAQPSTYVQTPNGIKEVPGAPAVPAKPAIPGIPAIPDKEIPANLNYWQQVKTELDKEIQKTLRGTSTNNFDLAALQDAKSKLVERLKSLVPSYETALDTSSALYKSSNAVEAGYNALKNMDSFDNATVIKAASKMTPQQAQMFSEGAGSYVKDLIAEKGPDGFLKTLDDPNVLQRTKSALGEEKFNVIYGKAKSESLLSKTQALSQSAIKPTTTVGNLITGGAGAAIAETGKAILSGNIPSNPIDVAVSLGGAVATLGAKGIYSAAESHIADKFVKLASSTDPKDLEKFGDLIQNNSVAKSFWEKTAYGAQQQFLRVQQAQRDAAENNQNNSTKKPFQIAPMARASGGRVKKSHEFLVNRLMKLAEYAKKDENTHTKSLLGANDEAVVRALAIAQKHI